jgi:hypothetical protein
VGSDANPCRSSRSPNADTSGRSIPKSQRLGLTAAPLRPAKESLAPGRKLLKDTEELVEAIDVCLATKPGGNDGNNSP